MGCELPMTAANSTMTPTPTTSMDPDTRCSVSSTVLTGDPVALQAPILVLYQGWISHVHRGHQRSGLAPTTNAPSQTRQASTNLPFLIHNLGAQLLANPVPSSNMKQIDVPYHFIRQCIANGSSVLRSISLADYIIDICTKPPGKVKFPYVRWRVSVLGDHGSLGIPCEGGW